MIMMPSIFKKNAFDDMWDEMMKMPGAYNRATRTGVMNADVQEFEDHFQLDLELPGYQKEELQAELHDGYLTVHAKHEEVQEDKKEGTYTLKERYTGECSRSFYVGEQIAKEDIHASFQNGILQVDIPKKKEDPQIEEDKQIEIL